MTREQLRAKRLATIATFPKVQEFDGIRFIRDDQTGYYRGHKAHENKPILMHRYVYEYYNGKIPKGFHIHHKNGLKWDNTKSNLELIEHSAHASMHGHNPSEEVREFMKENMDRQRPLTKAWHASAEGHEWHRKHAMECKRKGWSRAIVEITCLECGAKVLRLEGTKFCCLAHKAKWRRRQGIDNVERSCARCGHPFSCNKYSDAIYCSRKCAALANREKRLGWVPRRKQTVTMKCKNCGRSFRTNACNQKYCAFCRGGKNEEIKQSQETSQD